LTTAVTAVSLTGSLTALTLKAGEGVHMADHIVVQDSDDRPERMLRDPKGYFAEARKRAEQEVRQSGKLSPSGDR
jgi:hypothetical protein